MLRKLERIAPVTAIRRDSDRQAWADYLPISQIVERANRCIYILREVELPDQGNGEVVAHAVMVVPAHTSSNWVMYPPTLPSARRSKSMRGPKAARGRRR